MLEICSHNSKIKKAKKKKKKGQKVLRGLRTGGLKTERRLKRLVA